MACDWRSRDCDCRGVDLDGSAAREVARGYLCEGREDTDLYSDYDFFDTEWGGIAYFVVVEKVRRDQAYGVFLKGG